MPPNEWSINSAVARTRNWNPSSFIDAVFGPQNMSEGGEVAAPAPFCQVIPRT